MAFLRAHVQRRAAPAVPGVDLGAEGQQVVDDELLVGGGRDLKGRLCAESSATALHERHAPTRALFAASRAPRRHLRRERVRKSPSLLCHRHVKEPGKRRETVKTVSRRASRFSSYFSRRGYARVAVRILHVERLRSDPVQPPQLSLYLPVKQSRSRLGSRRHASALCVGVTRETRRDVRVHRRRRRAHRLLAAGFKRCTFERRRVGVEVEVEVEVTSVRFLHQSSRGLSEGTGTTFGQSDN
ncbi:hypothetical protein EYF80_033751 [Liparis tanakae]|uniref:Uncharacterized protein n=1 Tax=Liparis tanakae TaxID=230148 RepID=A0A4Z2GSD7_9TELE|nr:hypothetical protein EYF80_033751 [Liparis tanakae]